MMQRHSIQLNDVSVCTVLRGHLKQVHWDSLTVGCLNLPEKGNKSSEAIDKISLMVGFFSVSNHLDHMISQSTFRGLKLPFYLVVVLSFFSKLCAVAEIH